jgi:hypothetical protein
VRVAPHRVAAVRDGYPNIGTGGSPASGALEGQAFIVSGFE